MLLLCAAPVIIVCYRCVLLFAIISRAISLAHKYNRNLMTIPRSVFINMCGWYWHLSSLLRTRYVITCWFFILGWYHSTIAHSVSLFADTKRWKQHIKHIVDVDFPCDKRQMVSSHTKTLCGQDIIVAISLGLRGVCVCVCVNQRFQHKRKIQRLGIHTHTHTRTYQSDVECTDGILIKLGKAELIN